MNEYKIDPYLWFGERELNYRPKHFIAANADLTEDSKVWVLKNLKGRFSITLDNSFFMMDFGVLGKIAFEDPAECLAFELRWS